MAKGIKIKRGAFKGKTITFAPTEGIDQFSELCDEFMREILNTNGWVSDESELRDFTCGGEGIDAIYARIEERYGVNVHGKQNMLDIFRAIAAVNRTRQ